MATALARCIPEGDLFMTSARPRIARRIARQMAIPFFVLLAFLVSGCATTYQVSVASPDPARPDYDSQTMSSYFWGAQKSPRVAEVDCEGQGLGLNDVVVSDSFGADVLSVLTLGLWKRVKVEYRCHAG
jgi:hypothetical protein